MATTDDEKYFNRGWNFRVIDSDNEVLDERSFGDKDEAKLFWADFLNNASKENLTRLQILSDQGYWKDVK